MEKTKSLRTIKWVLPLLVAVFGVGVVFAVSGERRVVTAASPVVDEQWFIYNGEDPQLEASSYSEWVPQGEETEPDCSSNVELCAIRLDVSGGPTSGLDDVEVQAFINAKDTDNDDDLDANDYNPSDPDMKYRD